MLFLSGRVQRGSNTLSPLAFYFIPSFLFASSTIKSRKRKWRRGPPAKTAATSVIQALRICPGTWKVPGYRHPLCVSTGTDGLCGVVRVWRTWAD